MINEEHYFISKDIIYCKKMGGTFSKAIWELEKFPRKQCPCCNEICKFRLKKKQEVKR